jgi:transposase-like protein
MPWRPGNLVEEREAFVRLAESGDKTMATLCRSFGISRTTGYKRASRYQQPDTTRSGLQDQAAGHIEPNPQTSEYSRKSCDYMHKKAAGQKSFRSF